MSALATLPGFAKPVDQAQAVFRAVLEALSRPGIPCLLSALPPALAAGDFSPGMLALALALCDSDTPLWLDAAADTPQLRHHLRFHCAAPFVSSPAQASFAFIAQPEIMPCLDAFKPGQADFPDRSATLVLRANLSEAQGQTYELTGPGVKDNGRGAWQSFRAANLPTWFLEDWETNHAAYPQGVDIILVDDGADHSGAPWARLLGLPRTARIRKALPAKEGAACM